MSNKHSDALIVSVLLPPKLVQRIDAVAREQKRSRSAQIHHIVSTVLDRSDVKRLTTSEAPE